MQPTATPGPGNGTRLGVIADDLTGAAEIAGIAFEGGFRAEIHTRPGLQPDAELLVLDTHSRSMTGPEAGHAAASAARWLRTLQVRAVYKKVDSVLRGRIPQEVAAVSRELGLGRVLLLPQNPSRGRTIRQGRYLIDGRPIHETQFRLDPEYPRGSSNVRDLLDAADFPTLCLGTVDEGLPAAGICLAQASTLAEVRQWAKQVDPQTLPAGGADFFRAWLATLTPPPQGSPSTASIVVERPEFFICGSATESTREFVCRARMQGAEVFGLPLEIAESDPPGQLAATRCVELAADITGRLGSGKRVILEVGLPALTDPLAAACLSRSLARVAADVIRQTRQLGIYAEGGATAAAVAWEAGWDQFLVVAQPATGIVTLSPRGSPHRFTIKPGSYAWPPEIAERS